MKTIVDFDYKWALTGCMRYARRQVAMFTAIKEKQISADDFIKIVRASKDTKEAEETLVAKYDLHKMAAREMLEMPLQRTYCMDIDRGLAYYQDAAKKLDELLKSYE